MTKESKTHIERPKRVIFRETFADEQSVRRNGGTPTNVTFSKGVGEFNGTNSKVQINRPFKGTVSIRVVFASVTPLAGKYIVDFRTNDGAGYIYFSSDVVVQHSGGTRYVDGIPASAVSNNTKEIIITGILIDNNSGYIGCLRDGSSNFITADIDFVEIYNYALTQSEIANMAGI